MTNTANTAADARRIVATLVVTSPNWDGHRVSVHASAAAAHTAFDEAYADDHDAVYEIQEHDAV